MKLDDTYPFSASPSELTSLAQLLLSRVPYLRKMALRARFENSAISELKNYFSHEAADSLERICRLAGVLLKNAEARGLHDERIFHNLSLVCEQLGKLEMAHSYSVRALSCDEGSRSAARRHLDMTLRTASGPTALECAYRYTGLESDTLSFADILPFDEWTHSNQAELIIFGNSDAKVVAADISFYRDGGGQNIRYDVDQQPVRGAHCHDVELFSALIPIHNGQAMLHELIPGSDAFGTVAETPERFVYSTKIDRAKIDQPTIILTGNRWHFNNYYHCLIQNISRLALVNGDREFNDYKLAVPNFAKPWVFDLLKRIGYNDENIEIVRSYELTTFRECLVLEYNAIPNKSALDAVRRSLGVPDKAQGNRKVFSGRSGLLSSSRILDNETELMNTAEAEGFEIVDFAKLNVDDQLKLLSETTVFAGPNGAAFANILFGGRDMRVVCLSDQNFVGRWYPDIATLLGQQFHWCLGKTLPLGYGLEAAPKVPYIVDVRSFKAAVGKAVGSNDQESCNP